MSAAADTQGRTLRYSLAALTAVAALGLGLRLAGQFGALDAARADLATARQSAADLRRAAATGVGPPLLDARAASPNAALAQRLAALGLTVRETRMLAATPAGKDLAVARFQADGRADPAALDRLALWAAANGRSAILEQLTATAGADGKSDVQLQLDALVRGLPQKPPQTGS
ncbi:MAG TPA: hypothetical protein VGG29_12215 [Caulobacteraceae bacterium]|jgi:hypothetical protein